MIFCVRNDTGTLANLNSYGTLNTQKSYGFKVLSQRIERF